MIFKCRNCFGNVVYSPEKKKMYCPYCDSEESHEMKPATSTDMSICPDCGGVIPVAEHTSATQCPYCNNYLIFEQRVEGDYLPKMLIPFQMGKESCKKLIRDKFKKKVFAPTDFLSEVRLNTMQGTYVPYWFYDYDVNADYQAEATKVRSWSSGDMRYTETSYYDVRRNIDVNFRDIPVDASVDMPDDVMDLMQPYNYKELVDFQPQYLSGFYAEKYNMPGNAVEGRARKQMSEDASALAKSQVVGYSSVRQVNNNITVKSAAQKYGLLPVWKYMYTYKDKEYPFYVNGQTGKIVGSVPISTSKVWAYAGTLWACLLIILMCVSMWMSVLPWM
ncbi:MAG: hypothetical protein E7292_10920 [Lachnospiraceae bacterium]|nr:hypothetical protein [Lachnospiraceae bacterium]